MTIHRFYLPAGALDGIRICIDGDTAAQIRRVLRLGPGAFLDLFDGTGREVRARIVEVGASVIAEAVSEEYPATEAAHPVTLAQALLKGERMDWLVEKATELGAARILVFPAARSVVQVREERAERKAERWRRIAREAAEQCGRVRLPEVDLVASLTQALDACAPVSLLFADEAARQQACSLPEPGPCAVLVGPEGGWDPAERAAILGRGPRLLSLGPRILRAETAAMVAVARTAGR